MKPLHEDEGTIVSLDEPTDIVWLVRKPTTLTVSGLTEWIRNMDLVLPLSQRSKLAVLQDMRAAPMLSYPEQEKAIVELAQPWLASFRARAILIKTAVGRLQATRTTRDAGLPAGVFLDLDEALKYLREEMAKKRKP